MSETAGDTADKAGFYYDAGTSRLVEYDKDEEFQGAPAGWEFIGTSDEMTPADAVAALQQRYPEANLELKVIAKQSPGRGFDEMGESCQVEPPFKEV